MERRASPGAFAHLSEHLRRRRLVEADRVALGAADDAHRLEHAQHAQAGDLRRQLGLLPRERHEADRAEVVDLVGLDLRDHRDQRRQVAQIAVDQLQRRRLSEHHVGLGVVLAPDQPVDLVPLAGEELARKRPSWPVMPVISARFMPGDASPQGRADTVPVGVELVEELVAARFLVGLADRCCRATETVE